MRLIDAEELIENLLNDVELDEKMLNDTDFVGSSRELVQFDKDCKQNAIEFLRDAPTIEIKSSYSGFSNNWIPCSERLPEPRVDVWCNSDMGQMVGYYEENVETWYGRDYLELMVTAWMPLPEPWKGETK